jgi:hypothetical protein
MIEKIVHTAKQAVKAKVLIQSAEPAPTAALGESPTICETVLPRRRRSPADVLFLMQRQRETIDPNQRNPASMEHWKVFQQIQPKY